MKNLIVYVHGKGGSAEETLHYRSLFPESEVIGFDYRSQTPWEAEEEFQVFFAEQRKRCDSLTLVANSIGAFFSMSSLDETLVDQAYLISPVVDMEKLICDMMSWQKVTEEELAQRKEIVTDFGETLSWKYLCYVREHPISWRVPTCILYGEQDHLTSAETISAFAGQHGAKLTVMQGGEHWFHTEEQMRFLDDWINASKQKEHRNIKSRKKGTMERQYTRLDEARKVIDPIVKAIENEESKRSAYVHLYGVGLMASLLALKRGYTREVAELAEIAGILHDLLTYVEVEEDTYDHAHKCADYAREHVLSKLTSFSDEEKEMIYQGVYNHSDKNVKGNWFDEIIKDADAVQHTLRNPMENFFYEHPRIQQVLEEIV